MAGIICLQGGREFTAPCREMDAQVLRRAGPAVAVLAGAARVGDDYAGASDRARRHYGSLGAAVAVVPDPRTDASGAERSLRGDVDLLVLPGGSPGSLLDVLSGPLAALVRERHAEGMAISGASAGAMVLCERMVRPDRGADVVAGLGLVEGLALPHWQPGPLRWDVGGWVPLWGLPECGGVQIDDAVITAVGQGDASVLRTGGWHRVVRARPAP